MYLTGVSATTATSTTNGANYQVTSKNDTFTVPMVDEKKSQKKQKQPVPQDVQGQLDIFYKNAKTEVDDLPKWLSIFGTKKLKQDVVKMIDSKDFRTRMNNIFTEARKQKGSGNKDIIELLKEREVFDQVYKSLKDNAPEKSVLKTALGFGFVREKYYKMIKEGKATYMLYGEDK